MGWKLRTAEMCFGWILFGVNRMYRTRLQVVRIKGEIYLADFRELMRNFLAEWSGRFISSHVA